MYFSSAMRAIMMIRRKSVRIFVFLRTRLPIGKQLVDLFHRFFRSGIRFQKVGIGTESSTFFNIFLTVKIAEHYDFTLQRWRELPYDPESFKSVHPRHHDVQKNDVRFKIRNQNNGIESIFRNFCNESFFLEFQFIHGNQISVVLHHEYF